MVYYPIARHACFIYFDYFIASVFENYHVVDAENRLTKTAAKISTIVQETDDEKLGLSIARELADQASVVIVQDKDFYWHSTS
ncbi:hypothetical protein AAAC51_00010 [Priestia megaterium]